MLIIGGLTLAAALSASVNPLLTALVGQQEDGNPRLIKGMLKTVNFGSTASVVLTMAGADKTFRINDQTKYSVLGNSQNLTGLYQTSNNKDVWAVVQKESAGVMLKQVWDLDKWGPYVSTHKTSIMGQVKFLGPKLLQLGDYNFVIKDTTQFVLGGQPSTRAKLVGKPQLWVKGDHKLGEPYALIIADTSEGLGIQPSGNTRPPSSGSTRPPSSGGGTRPTSTGNGQSPTERDNTRPTSTGTGNLSPTEKAAQIQRGFAVNIYFKITNSDDMPAKVGNQAGGDVVRGAAREVGAEDKTLEIFGDLKFNGATWWSIDQKNAIKQGQGSRLDIAPKSGAAYAVATGFLVKAETLKLVGSLKDDDDLSKSDMIFKVNQTINLFEAAGKGWVKYNVKNAKAEMYIWVGKK